MRSGTLPASRIMVTRSMRGLAAMTITAAEAMAMGLEGGPSKFMGPRSSMDWLRLRVISAWGKS